jgi:hypothetical protein
MMSSWLTADWVAAIAALLAVFVPLIWGLFTLRKSVRQISIDFEQRHYAELDRLHFELLRMRIENPDLAYPEFSRPAVGAPAESARREYGCLVWSFIESVLDYCDKPGRNFGAWAPAVAYESSAYRSWLTPGNLARFEPNFLARVERLIADYNAEHGYAHIAVSRVAPPASPEPDPTPV